MQSAAAARADAQPALAITDQSNLFGTIKFYKACRRAGVKPLIGAAVAFAILFLVHTFIAGVSPLPH